MRTLAALVLLAGVLLAGGCHPANTRDAGFSYGASSYPAKPGSRWLFRQMHYQDGKLIGTWEEETKLERVDGDLLTYGVQTRMGNQKTNTRFFLVKRPDALYYQSDTPPVPEGSGHSLKDAVMLLKFPLAPDQHWTYQHPTEGAAERTVMDEETVTVPAGTYKTVRIDEKRESGFGTSWFAPDVGMVRFESERYKKELLEFAAAPSR